MSSTFQGLNTSLNGLYTSQTALYVTNNNISNANMPGYSRQVIEQTACTPMSSYQGTGMIGSGSEVVAVTQVRDEFLDYRYWDENSSLGEWEVKSSYLSEIEKTLGEPSDYGYTTIMNGFYNAMEELSKDSSSGASRALVEQTGETVCEYFNVTASNLLEIQQDINNGIKIKVDEINSLAKQISDLNEQIYTSELNGDNANGLRDQRVLLIDELSKLVDIESSEVAVGTLQNGEEECYLQITLNGSYLVNNSQSYELECCDINEGSDNDGMNGIKWKDTGVSVEPTGGEP